MEYVIAWSVYVAAGLGCLLVLLRITREVSRGVRNLLVGFFIVLTFTPWFVGDSFDYYAPAALVFMMDLLLEGTKHGSKAGIPLLFASLLMLLTLVVLEIVHRHRSRNKVLDQAEDTESE